MIDRRVFLVIWSEDISDEAKAAYRRNERELTEGQRGARSRLPPIYEGWSSLPKNAQLIDIFYGPRGSVFCSGALTRTHEIRFTYRDGSKGHLAVCRKDKQVMGLSFTPAEAASFARSLKPLIEDVWFSPLAKGDESGKYILLADVLQIVANRKT
jgi:hypothetical protein